MSNELIIIAYLIYLPLVILLTWYVATALFRNGQVFMLDIFHGRQEIALSTNRLFQIGFYLLNLGFALWILKVNSLDNYQEMVEALSMKVGGFSIYLGVILFFNLYLFFRGKKIAKSKRAPVVQ